MALGPAAVLAAAFVLIALTFLFSNPPGAAPDEGAHYLRAVGVGRGQFVLDKPPARPPTPPGLERQMIWMWMQSGMVTVPARLDPAPFECWAHPFYVGDCAQAAGSSGSSRFQTYVGSYAPFPYLLSGLLTRGAETAEVALVLGRIGIFLVSMPLLGAAVAALYDVRRRLWPLGLLLTVTPMVLYSAASLTSSGVEISAAICFFACLLRLARDARLPAEGSSTPGAPRWVWLAAAASGLVLGISRDLGPAWIGLHLGLVGIFSGRERVRAAWASSGRRRTRAAALGVLVLAVGVALVWRVAASVPPDLSRLELPRLTAESIGGLLRQAVGVFGPLDATMPDLAYWVWGLLFAGVVGAALLLGTWSHRAALALGIVAAIAVTYALEGAQNIYGFGVQSRHVLPAVVCIPLLAGEIVSSCSRPRWLLARPVLPLLAGAVAVVHLTAWHTLGRRFAVGSDGPVIFFWEPAWSPPGGWILWGGLLSVALLLMVLPFVDVVARKEPDHQ